MTRSQNPSYRLSFPEPEHHLVEVDLEIPAPGTTLELWMPVWTPGSYLIREYARNLEGFRATSADGEALPWEKTAKNTWRVETRGAAAARIAYRIYGREKSVRTDWIDDAFALINGAPTFLFVRGRESLPHEITVEPAVGWTRVLTALDADPSEPFRFIAANLDELVDSPIVAGTPAVYDFTVDDCRLTLVNQGESGLWDGERAAADLKTIVEAYRDLYGSLPTRRYLFHNLLVEAGGGLEHKNSCVLMASRFAFRDRKSYVGWLGLASHEFLHVWNVKRSRPVELGPFDYEREVYTRSLWVAEGFTAYYTDLMPRRAGLTTDEEYLERLSGKLNLLQSTPGRRMQSLEESSFDAWIKLYRPDENTGNSTVSYYLKGCVVSWLLDVELRRRSSDERSLDDLMRLLYARYSDATGFTPADIREAAETIAGESLESFFTAAVRGTAELDYEPALEWLGLRFREEPGRDGAWLGITTAGREGRLEITSVRRDGPAYTAGLDAEDELLALGGFRVTGKTLADRLRQYRPGDRLEVLVARAGAVRALTVTLGTNPAPAKQLEFDPEAGAGAVARRRQWLWDDVRS